MRIDARCSRYYRIVSVGEAAVGETLAPRPVTIGGPEHTSSPLQMHHHHTSQKSPKLRSKGLPAPRCPLSRTGAKRLTNPRVVCVAVCIRLCVLVIPFCLQGAFGVQPQAATARQEHTTAPDPGKGSVASGPDLQHASTAGATAPSSQPVAVQAASVPLTRISDLGLGRDSAAPPEGASDGSFWHSRGSRRLIEEGDRAGPDR